MDNKKLKIGIVDYDAGNLFSIHNALTKLSIQSVIVKQSSDSAMQNISHLILPGVGSFESAMKSLNDKEWSPFLVSWINAGKPFLGICLGMQLLLDESEESPGNKGLGIIKGKNKRITAKKVPHIGWNELIKSKDRPAGRLSAIDESSYYFVHSYYADCNGDHVTHVCRYFHEFPAVLEMNNCFGVQFHPEKSGKAGLLLLKKWALITVL